MKNLLIITILLFSINLISQDYILIDPVTDTTYIKKTKGKFYEYHKYTDAAGREITIKQEIKSKKPIIAKIEKEIKALNQDLEFINDEIKQNSEETQNLLKRRNRINHKIKTKKKRIKNIEKRMGKIKPNWGMQQNPPELKLLKTTCDNN